jgi:Family of unknown function (DUF6704)
MTATVPSRLEQDREEPAMSGVPHVNHGNSVAAWTAVTVVMVASLVCAIAILVAAPWLFWVGVALIVVGVASGKVLQMMGFGMDRSGQSGMDRGGRSGMDRSGQSGMTRETNSGP